MKNRKKISLHWQKRTVRRKATLASSLAKKPKKNLIMKKILSFFFPLLLSGSISLMAQNIGIGTVTPENTLHIFKGTAGIVTAIKI